MSSLDFKFRALGRRDGLAFPAEPCPLAVQVGVHGHLVTFAPIAPTRVGGELPYPEDLYKGGLTEATNLDMSLCSILLLHLRSVVAQVSIKGHDVMSGMVCV